MKKFLLASFALLLSITVAPRAVASTFLFTLDGSDFTSTLVLTTTGTGSTQLITDAQGLFDITGNPSVYFTTLPTETPNPGSNASNLTFSSDGQFEFDNLLYTTAGGNSILDWGGFLVDVNGYEINIFSGTTAGGGPGNGYLYFADNASYHFADTIPSATNPNVPASFGNGGASLTQVSPYTVVLPNGQVVIDDPSGQPVVTPEPGSLFLVATGMLGLAGILYGRFGLSQQS